MCSHNNSHEANQTQQNAKNQTEQKSQNQLLEQAQTSASNFPQEFTSPISLQDQDHNKQLSYNDFEKIDFLGEGAYGPFLVRLRYSFQTNNKLYLVMEYCPGGELYTYLARNKRFSIELSKFIAAEVVLGMEYLNNNMKIIYRDLKPENILVTEDGHLKITDFGLSKQMVNEDELSFTFIGTPEYIAPEVIKSKQSNNRLGYNASIDIWAFGVFLYEIIFGMPPFRDKQRNWYSIMKQILANNPNFITGFNEEAVDLIKSCLNSDPEKRLSWSVIKQHKFFENIDWKKLYKKEYESPLKQFIIKKKQDDKLTRQKPIFETLDQKQMPGFEGFTYNPQDGLTYNPEGLICSQEGIIFKSEEN
ncbi:protein kinase domain protein [Ichthyophthirius multifiliis]|uniref:Protein kinase domain protein n=1 Tax=Ichthyophthirius multifiliis TaxID=5932 RepID=G0QS99_ICHMU|nr:protein kinase domain protein [Ichthyophthirius multifiliis]EGR31897.1 protein kinase domain protein [Ichthyophthirius multifiliis]|eukprot:XP_004035383.1 protein kinase domain protein [Ichthyophthirius multifiliis]